MRNKQISKRIWNSFCFPSWHLLSLPRASDYGDYGIMVVRIRMAPPPLAHICESVVTRWWNCWGRIRKVWRGEVCHLGDGGVLRFQKPWQFPVSSLCLTFVGQHVSSQHWLGTTLACLVAAMLPIITVMDSPSQTVSPPKALSSRSCLGHGL